MSRSFVILYVNYCTNCYHHDDLNPCGIFEKIKSFSPIENLIIVAL